MKASALALALTCATVIGLVSSPAAAKEMKVAYVNMQRIVAELPQAQKARDKLRNEFTLKQKQLDGLQKEFEKSMEDFEKGKHMMKPEVRMQRETELKQKYAQLHQTLMKLQQELGEKEAEMAQSIHVKIRALVEAIGDRDGYDLVLDNSAVKGTVLFFKRHLDITDQVIAMYKTKHGKG